MFYFKLKKTKFIYSDNPKEVNDIKNRLHLKTRPNQDNNMN